jgi:hypothetical protein
MARKSRKAAPVAIANTRLAQVTIVPTVVTRKAARLSWQAVCATAAAAKYAYSELASGVKIGMAKSLD